METSPRRLARLARLAPALLATLLALSACSGGVGHESADREGGVTSSSDRAAPAEAPGAGAAEAFQGEVDSEADAETDDGGDRAVISTGTVSLLDDDVAAVRFEVQKVVDARGGEIAEEKTQTDRDGEVQRSRLVVRVPAADFGEAMTELEGLARLESSSRRSEDVTTEVIDTRARIRAQEASLRRVEVLLARARTIRDIVAIEAQLTRRQADLDSLKSRAAYLADQTSLSTITVFLAQAPDRQRMTGAAAIRPDSGFTAGLRAGWDGVAMVLGGAATLAGVLLPVGLLLAGLGLPVWLGLRRLRAGRTGRTPSAA